MTDQVQIMCPSLTCRTVLAVPASARGKTVRCKACQTNIRVPGGKRSAPAKSKSKPRRSA